MLKWARERNCPWDESSAIVAAQCGHAELLQWLQENGCPGAALLELSMEVPLA